MKSPLQPALPFPPPDRARGVTARQAKSQSHDAANREAAEVVLADPEHYGGESAALVEWARRVMRKVQCP